MAAGISSSSMSATRGRRVVGDYMLSKQIGSGSFSVVWLATNRRTGEEVAVKEIATDRLGAKLQESLLSEIVILKKIKHPNIIALHEIIETPGRIFIILEYCKGGDLAMYIQRNGRVQEAAAKYFMLQLASGLQVLRENNLIHRDLKPQNLLLYIRRSDDPPTLKIADFGFARSLQPRGLAETLCGSPLYMAPEIMQLQKYDAKADLWSVGTILFQLITGKPPYTGSNQIQLLQNIMKSTELRFPSDVRDLSSVCVDLCQKLLRRNPVERLTFEEFFNHPFLSQNCMEESSGSSAAEVRDSSLMDDCPHQLLDMSSQVDPLPFVLGGTGRKSHSHAPLITSTRGFSVDNKADKKSIISSATTVDVLLNSSKSKLETNLSIVDSQKPSRPIVDQSPASVAKEDRAVADSLEFSDQDYVLVPGPPLEVSSSSLTASRTCESESSAMSLKTSAVTAPMPIVGAVGKTGALGIPESTSSPPSGTSLGSLDIGDVMEQPSSDCMTRLRSLQQCASAVADLVNERVAVGRQLELEAFSIQLVILAIWKQALHICHTQAASATEGSPCQEGRLKSMDIEARDSRESQSSTSSQQHNSVYSDIERAFLSEVEKAEALASNLGPVDETLDMPDAMEIIFQSALALGRNGAVEELMDNMESATVLYSKAVQLLYFLLVEAPSLILNPPFSLTTSERFRLRSYIDILNNRQSHYRSQRMAIFKGDD